jgi:hypothetical protein
LRRHFVDSHANADSTPDKHTDRDSNFVGHVRAN